MSATQMLIANLQALSSQDRSAVFAAFGVDNGANGAANGAAKPGKAAKVPKAEKKPRANAGRGTAWSAFSVKIQLEHKAEMDALKLEAAAKRAAAKAAGLPAPEDTKGAHLHWCSAYKTAHEDEWLAFKATWELEHPKVSAAASAESTDEDSSSSAAIGGGGSSAAAAPVVTAPKAKPGPKKMADMTPEELAAAKAKRAAKKAEKASAVASAAVSATNSDTEARAPSPKTKSE